MSDVDEDTIRAALIKWTPDGFRDDEGIWREGSSRADALAALVRLGERARQAEAERDTFYARIEAELARTITARMLAHNARKSRETLATETLDAIRLAVVGAADDRTGKVPGGPVSDVDDQRLVEQLRGAARPGQGSVPYELLNAAAAALVRLGERARQAEAGGLWRDALIRIGGFSAQGYEGFHNVGDEDHPDECPGCWAWWGLFATVRPTQKELDDLRAASADERVPQHSLPESETVAGAHDTQARLAVVETALARIVAECDAARRGQRSVSREAIRQIACAGCATGQDTPVREPSR